MPRFTLLYHMTAERRMLPVCDERSAVVFAQSESGILRNTVSVWLAGEPVACFRCGEEHDLTPEQYKLAHAVVTR